MEANFWEWQLTKKPIILTVQSNKPMRLYLLIILLIFFINPFLFFALPYPFKDTQRCKSNNTTKERNILWHSTTQNQWNENYVMGNSTFFFFFGAKYFIQIPVRRKSLHNFLDTCWGWQSCRFPLSSLIMRYFKLHSWRWHIFNFLYHQSPNIPNWVLLLWNYNVAQYLFIYE